MDIIQDYFDFSEGLDFTTKYGLIISNFLVIVLILCVQKYRQVSNPIEPCNKKNILFVLAHPDDEAMFFIPTIKNIKHEYKIHLLCLSNGDFDKIGHIREKELENCCKFLQFDKLKIVKDEKLQDGQKENWSSEYIADIIQEYAKQEDIKAIITFDNKGVSGHANHISAFKGVEFHKKSYMKQQNGDTNESDRIVEKYYKLETVNMLRKYSGILDFFLSVIMQSEYMYLNINPFTAWKGMKIHKSQFVWYRKLFVIFSRYAYINTLKEIK